MGQRLGQRMALPADYFYREPWRRDGPAELRHYTCVRCDVRFMAFDEFRAHRLVCRGHREKDAF